MLFNSLAFLIFGLLFFSSWFFLRRKRAFRWPFLILASFIFYGWWDPRYLVLIVFSGLLDYFVGRALVAFRSRKRFFLFLSIFGNIGVLGAFKYSGFVAENLDLLLNAIGIAANLQANLPEFALVLPVGISFYTFQSMSYTIDVYKGKLKPTNNVFHFFAYLSLFPQLVAGPIVRARDLLPQLAEERTADEQKR